MSYSEEQDIYHGPHDPYDGELTTPIPIWKEQWFGYSAWPSFFRLLRRLKRTVDGGSFDRDMHVGEQARLSGQ